VIEDSGLAGKDLDVSLADQTILAMWFP